MRPDLPWNVAGIPPEAREAARAAARREGLSVGEWLTRRILRSFSDASGDFEGSGREQHWRETGGYHEDVRPTRHDTDDMLAHVSRSEADSNAAFRRIEDQMRIVARRLDATERSQSENNRAMSKAAAEINVATREQAQAFDQLGSSVMGLAERIDRVERSVASDGMKDAVKGLHQGLSRLADQIGQTANQSATQFTALANNVESVAGKVGEARRDSETMARALEQRIVQIAERVAMVERQAQANLSDIERVRANENAVTVLQESVSRLEDRGEDPAIDKRLGGIERTLAEIAGRMEAAERDDTRSGVEESVKSLQQRIEAAEKRHREALSELREAVTSASGRLAAVETMPHPLTGGGPNPAFAPPTNGAQHPLAGAPSFASQPQAFAPQPQPFAPQPQAFTPPQAPFPAFDAPPFPDNVALPPNMPPFQNPNELPPHPAPAFDTGAMLVTEPFPHNSHDAFAQQPTAQVVPGESFLAAARRSAQAAAAQAEAERSARGFGAFSWGSQSSVQKAPQRSRLGLIAILALLIVLAVVAGILFNQRIQSPVSHSSGLSALFSSKNETPAPAQTPASGTASAIAPNTAPQINTNTANPRAGIRAAAPSSPVLQPLHAQPVRTAPIHRVPAAAQTAPAPQSSAYQPVTPPQRNAGVPSLDRISALANQGNPKAETIIGLKYIDGDGVAVNETEAAKWLSRAAQKGEPVAEYRLGTLLERGRGVPADAAKAMHWYQLAAQAGNRKAMHNLAVAYAQGTGVPKDYAEAARWFSKAAALGLADSQFNLAVLYERGLGVPQSLLDAYKWYAIAASQGDQESKARIGALTTQLSADDRAAAQRSADMFKPLPMDRTANTPPEPSDLAG